MNLKELASVFHFPVGIGSQPQLKEAKAGIAPAPIEMGQQGIILGVNSYRGKDTEIHLAREDRIEHLAGCIVDTALVEAMTLPLPSTI